ncbi:hypothetical protein H6P81_001105 [Aristolochia fimbriata]|uniref:Uncharacterized protein n=1 Tax=Aristolochia fimbriata TaxID=158543 RepID=A0AAV7F993_ARIFI|nr:hypothetical protein H6P81_001105 [Aristolochia fimbriata]
MKRKLPRGPVVRGGPRERSGSNGKVHVSNTARMERAGFSVYSARDGWGGLERERFGVPEKVTSPDGWILEFDRGISRFCSMTADTNECVAVPASPALEFEAKSGLNPCEDQTNAGGCNGTPRHHGEDHSGEVKDDSEASYVFVNGDSDDGAEKDIDVDPIAASQSKSNVEPPGNCLESRTTATESLISGQDGQIHAELSNAEAESVEKDVVVEEAKELNSSEESQAQVNVSDVVTSGTLSPAGPVEVSGEVQQSELEVTPAEPVSGAPDDEVSENAKVSLDDQRSELNRTFAEKNSEKKNTIVDNSLENESTDAVDSQCSMTEATNGSVEAEDLMTGDAALPVGNKFDNENPSTSCDGRGEPVPVCVEFIILDTEVADGSADSNELVVNEPNIEESNQGGQIINELNKEESTEGGQLAINELNTEANDTEREELVVSVQDAEATDGSSEGREFVVNGHITEATNVSIERGEFLINDTDPVPTDGSADRGEGLVNQDTEATEASAERRELLVNDQDTEATDESYVEGELVITDSPTLESKTVSISPDLEPVTDDMDDAKLDSENLDSADTKELIVADTNMEESKTVTLSPDLEPVTDDIDDAKLDSENLDFSDTKELIVADTSLETLTTSQEMKLVADDIDNAKVDSEISDSADTREKIVEDTRLETKSTIDCIESAETVHDVNKNGSITTEVEGSNTNTNCSAEGRELAMCHSDVEEHKSETSDASVKETFQKNTGKDLLEEERLGSAGRSDTTEPQEVVSGSVEDVKPETELENSFGESGQNISVSLQKDINAESEVTVDFAENKSNSSVDPGDDMESEVELGKLHIESKSRDEAENGESLLVSSSGEVKSGVELTNSSVENAQSVPQVSGETENCVERNQCLLASPVDGFNSESNIQNDNEGGNKYEPPTLVDVVKIESDCSATSVLANGDILTSGNDDEKLVSEDVGVHLSPQEDSTPASLDAQKTETESLKRGPSYIIRVPRFVNDELRAKINQAQLVVNQKTQERDSIRVSLQAKKATCAEYWDNVVAARAEERTARNAVNAKFREMDSVQLIVNRMKNATSVEEIDERIDGMEHMIQHETMQLKEEKQLIREIKQLKQAREQLCASMGTHAEVQEAFDQRDNIEERIKALRLELDSFKRELARAEGATRAAKKKHSDEYEILKNLQAQFKDADSLRQQAYAEFQSLKKQMYEKSKYFHMYKDDQKAAADLASAGDREALWRFCSDQVEKFMELWNKNDEFRTEYVKHNIVSTVRRLRTLDGRSLGPDEEPPVVMRSSIEERSEVPAIPVSVKMSTPETMLEAPGAPVTPEKAESKTAVESVPKNLSTKSKMTSKPSSAENAPASVSGRSEVSDEPEEIIKKERTLSKEEEELARKEEELRREEAAAKLKEQRRLEEIAKAKEAEERKRRNAERAKARAELRAKKEAELKEKEREKRARKKERKRGIQVDESSGDAGEDTSQVLSENVPAEPDQHPDVKEKVTTVIRRYSKSMAAVKTKSVPPLPLRNRGKRRMQPWMWWALFAVALIVVFLAVNSSFSTKFSQFNLGF